ncbi:nuclear transport factor 2 family protein [Glycomyces sp. NPDC049804]|uniref:nuclear transport factor 2 family protein n=1 Tax=Glycomyces sp. NPDC049804 TaxID=3154363 RepID=UPI0034141048
MTISADDRAAVFDLLAMHGHLIDAGELDRLGEILTCDAIYDVTSLGAPALEGIDAIREAALTLGAGNPVGHLVTNTVLSEAPDGSIRARSKGLGVNADGTAGTVTYLDTVVRTGEGWRIGYREVIAHSSPLGGKGGGAAR